MVYVLLDFRARTGTGRREEPEKAATPEAVSRETGRKGGAAFSKEVAGSCSTKAATAAGCAA